MHTFAFLSAALLAGPSLAAPAEPKLSSATTIDGQPTTQGPLNSITWRGYNSLSGFPGRLGGV